MLDFRLTAFSNRPAAASATGTKWRLPVLAHGVPIHAKGSRLGGVLKVLAMTYPSVLPSAMLNDLGTPFANISRLNPLPAFVPVNASMAASRLGVDDWSQDGSLDHSSSIHYSTPTYLGPLSSLLTGYRHALDRIQTWKIGMEAVPYTPVVRALKAESRKPESAT